MGPSLNYVQHVNEHNKVMENFFFNFLDRPSFKDYISVFVLPDSHFSWIFEILLALNSELLFRTERGVMEGT